MGFPPLHLQLAIKSLQLGHVTSTCGWPCRDKKKKKEGGDEGDEGDEEETSGRGAEEQGGEDDEDEVVWLTDTSAEAVKRRAEEQLTAATAAMVTQGNIEAEAEAARRRAEKEAARKAEEEASAAAAVAAAAQRELAQRRAAAAAAGEKLDAANATALLAELLAAGDAAMVEQSLQTLVVEGGLAGKMRALYEALFLPEGQVAADAESAVNGSSSPAGGASSTRIKGLVEQHAPLLRSQGRDSQGQLAQLVALEHLLGVAAPARIREAALALKALYDADIAEEDIILAWYDREDAAKVLGVPAAAAAAVRRMVEPVVDWLREAEESEEGVEEDHDE